METKVKDLYFELREDFPTKEDLESRYNYDVQHGADGETVLGYLLDYCKDVYSMPKPDAYQACKKLLERYGLNK